MTTRRPLVLVDGEAVQLPTGDSLPGGVSLNSVTYQWDFLSLSTNADIWTGQAISSGTNNGTTASIVDDNHPGVVRLNSTTTTNSGYRYTSNVATTATMVLKNGSKFNAVIRAVGETDSRLTIGFMSNNAAGVPPTGAIFQISGLGLTASCLSSGSSTDYAMSNLTAATWYNFEIVYNSPTSVTFTVYNEAGVVVETITLTSNVPSGPLGSGLVAWTAGTANIVLVYVDLVRLTIPNLQRG